MHPSLVSVTCRFLMYELMLYIVWLVSFITFSLLFEGEVRCSLQRSSFIAQAAVVPSLT